MSKYNLEYFYERTKGEKWGAIIEDDRYWDDIDLYNNFFIFYVYAFSYLNLPAPTRMQLEIANYIQNRDNMNRLVWSPRGISKSLTSQIYVVWRLLNNPDEHILVLSQSSDRAKSYTQFVKKLIALLPITRMMSPRNNIERTSSASFDVAGATASDSPSVYASGVNNSIAGMRASLLIIDDVETHMTVQSQAMIERTEAGVKEARNLLMSGHNESITLATPHSQNSIYLSWLDRGTHAFICSSRVPEDTSVYMGFLAPFIQEKIDNGAIVGEAIDERLNDEFLRMKAMELGKSGFKLQFMADVSDADELKHPLKLSDLIVSDVSAEDAPLKIGHSSMPDNMLYIKHHGFKADKLYSPMFTSDERDKYDMKVMSIDPAGLGKDEVGISIMFTLNTRIFVKTVTGLMGGYSDDNLTTIANLCKLYGIDTCIVEKNFGNGMFAKMLEPFLKRISGNTAIEEVTATGQKELRIIECLEPLLNQHRIIIDKDTLDKDNNVLTKNSFTYQLSHITKDRGSLLADDRLDSFSQGVTHCIDNMGNDEEFGFDRFRENELDRIAEVNEKVFNDFDKGFSFGRMESNYGLVY